MEEQEGLAGSCRLVVEFHTIRRYEKRQTLILYYLTRSYYGLWTLVQFFNQGIS